MLSVTIPTACRAVVHRGRELGSRRIRHARVIIAAFAIAGLFQSEAVANSSGAWIKQNTDCSGICHILGMRSNISFPSKFTIVSNQFGTTHVGMLSTGVQWAETGGWQGNSFSNGDCDINDTNGQIRNFDEINNSNNNMFCVVYSGEVGGETHTYKAQRWATSECGLTNCVSNFIDQVKKQKVSFPGAEASFGYAQGELGRNSGTWFNSNTVVTSDFPGSGSTKWGRTSDVFATGGGGSTWVDITSASTGGNGTAGYWRCGTLTAGFTIEFLRATTGNCP